LQTRNSSLLCGELMNKMLKESSFLFLADLKDNNHREWFQNNRKRYEDAKLDFLQFIEKIVEDLCKEDPTLKGILAKDTLFRINKDTRFSKDKSPYKTNFGSGISRDGKKLPVAGYYFHLEPGKSFLAAGIYMPEPEKLKVIREEIAYDSHELDAVFNKPSFRRFFNDFDTFDKLANAPKGFDKHHPKLEWLKQKSFIVSANLSDDELRSAKAVEKVSSLFRETVPLILLINKWLGK